MGEKPIDNVIGDSFIYLVPRSITKIKKGEKLTNGEKEIVERMGIVVVFDLLISKKLKKLRNCIM
jgi:hypothetical protein